MKPFHIVLMFSVLILGCKSQASSSSVPISPLMSLEEYQANPDETILKLLIKENLRSEQGKHVYVAEVIKQMQSGSGFKDRIAPGSSIVLNSPEQLINHSETLAVLERLGLGSGNKYELKLRLKN